MTRERIMFAEIARLQRVVDRHRAKLATAAAYDKPRLAAGVEYAEFKLDAAKRRVIPGNPPRSVRHGRHRALLRGIGL